MDTDEVIWIVVAGVVVLALAVLAWLAVRQSRARKQEERRERAAHLRTEAQQHAQTLPEAELRAREEQLRAEKLHLEAERAQARAQDAEVEYLQESAQHEDRLREADRIDPDAHADRAAGEGSREGLSDDSRGDVPPTSH